MMTSVDKKPIDPRVYLFLLLAGAICGMLAHSETALFLLFIVSLFFQVIAGNASKTLGYLAFWFILFEIAQLGVMILRNDPAMGIGITVLNIGLSGHRALIPLLFAMLLYRVPTGSFMAALNAMHLPKAVGIGIGIALRFFPTVSQEYRIIRNSQKFRGVGLGFWNTILHLPGTTSAIILPLVIRITRIAEELSASVTVRGVRFSGKVVSFRPIYFSSKDTALLCAGLAGYIATIFADKLILGVAA